MKNLVYLFLFFLIIDISIGKKFHKTTAFRFQQQEQNSLSHSNGMDEAPFMKLFMKSPQELLKHYKMLNTDQQRFVSTNQTQFQTFFGGLSQEKVYDQLSHMNPKDVQLSQPSAMRLAECSGKKRSPDTYFWQVKDYSSNKVPYDSVVASDTYNSAETQPEWSLFDDKHQSWFSHWFFQKDISHVTVEYSFKHAQKIKAFQIWFVKPPGEFKTEYSPDGVEWITYKTKEDDQNEWRIGLNEKEQTERKQGKFFTDYLWDTNIVGNTFVDELPQLTTILKVRYTLRSPVMWHYGIWYAAAFTDIYTGQIKSQIKGSFDLCVTVNSGLVPDLADNLGRNLIIERCLDALLLNDERDMFVFTPDHKIRSYYNQQLCLEGALNQESITMEDCNNGHKKYQTWHLGHSGQLKWHDSNKCMYITGDEAPLQKQPDVVINCTSTVQDNQHNPEMMIDGQQMTWWQSEEDVEKVIVEMQLPHVKRVKKIRLVFKYPVKSFVLDGQYEDGEYLKIHEEVDSNGLKTFEWDIEEQEFIMLKLQLLESGYKDPVSEKVLFGIESFEAYSFMKTVGIEECKDSDEGLWSIELMTWYDGDHYRQKWNDEYHSLLLNEQNLLFALRDLAEADTQIILEITMQQAQKQTLDKLDEMIEKIDKYMNIFQFKWLKAEAEKNSEMLRASQLGNNEFKPIQSCAHVKRQYPFKKTGFYWIQDLCMKDPLRMYCNFEQPRITSYHYIGYTEVNVDYKDDIQDLKDIRMLCANKGLSMLALQGEKDITDVQAYLMKLGLTFKENNMIPLGYDYGCNSPQGCTQKFISFNSIYSYDVSPFFLHMLDRDNIWMQPFKDKTKRDAVGFGVGSNKVVSFEIGDVNLPVKGVVCGQNYDIEKDDDSFLKIECDTIARFNPDFDGVQYTNIRVFCPRDCVGKTEEMQQIWGNTIFKDDSYICLAGIHNGVITNQDGGKFIVGMMTGRNFYKGYESNRVKSLEWNTEWDRSYVVNKFNKVCPIDFVLSQKEKEALEQTAFIEEKETINLKKLENTTPINVGQIQLPQFMQTRGNGEAEWNANWFASDQGVKKQVIQFLKEKYPDLNNLPEDTEPSFDTTKQMDTSKKPDQVCSEMLQGTCGFVFDGTSVTGCIGAKSIVAIACAPPPLPPVNESNDDLRSTAKAMEYVKGITDDLEKDIKRQIQVAQDSRLMLADVQGKLSVATTTDISYTSQDKKLNTWDAHARTTFNVGMDMLSQSKIKSKAMEDEEFMLAAKEQTYYIYKVFEMNYMRILPFNWETHINLKSENIKKEEIPWIYQKDGLKGHSDAIHQTTEIKISDDILATSILLKNKLYYDAQFKCSIRMMKSGLVGIIFRAVDHENFYSFELQGGDNGFKRIRRYKNGKGKSLFKVDDGGFLEDTWYTVLIQMTGYHITVRMEPEKDPNAKIETLQEMQMVASVSHGQFPGGTIGFGVNGCKDYFIDNIVVEPQECVDTRHLPPIKQKDPDGNKQASEEPPSGFIFMPANCNRWVETFTVDIQTVWRFIDPDSAREGPSVWRYSQRFNDYIYVLAQETKIYDPTEDMTPAIAELSVPKICGEGVLATTLMGMEMNDDAYVGIGFKYIKKTDFFSFEVYNNKCQVRQILDGEWKDPIAVNDQCNITSEKFHTFHISMNSTGHTLIYKDLEKVLDFEVNPEYHYGGMAMLSFKTHAFFVNQKMMPHLDFTELPVEVEEESDSEDEIEPVVEPEPEPESESDSDVIPATSDLESELDRIKHCSNKTTVLERQDYCKSIFVGDEHSINACQLENNFCGVCCDRNTQEGHDQIHGICTKECTVQFHTQSQPIQDLEWAFCVNPHSTTSNSAYFQFCENHSRDEQSQLNCKNDMCNLCCMSISNILNLKLNDDTDQKCRGVCYEQFGSKIIPEI